MTPKSLLFKFSSKQTKANLSLINVTKKNFIENKNILLATMFPLRHTNSKNNGSEMTRYNFDIINVRTIMDLYKHINDRQF